MSALQHSDLLCRGNPSSFRKEICGRGARLGGYMPVQQRHLTSDGNYIFHSLVTAANPSYQEDTPPPNLHEPSYELLQPQSSPSWSSKDQHSTNQKIFHRRTRI
ncbi:hypothetical protein RvY_08725 [Ramazzottius varieornatus]|uniref:Uncharacterized protein n=1 Tax=Ramazzottius varieornatus TaxID=947166 RepID=A0A1D1V6W9_RAMVA|nr:hypothetical protein RvY_08725 [Ramazzottius varieornatus]